MLVVGTGQGGHQGGDVRTQSRLMDQMVGAGTGGGRFQGRPSVSGPGDQVEGHFLSEGHSRTDRLGEGLLGCLESRRGSGQGMEGRAE